MVMFNLRLSLSKKGDDRLFGETPIVIFHYALTHSNAYLDGKENCTNLQSWTPFVLTKKKCFGYFVDCISIYPHKKSSDQRTFFSTFIDFLERGPQYGAFPRIFFS